MELQKDLIALQHRYLYNLMWWFKDEVIAWELVVVVGIDNTISENLNE